MISKGEGHAELATERTNFLTNVDLTKAYCLREMDNLVFYQDTDTHHVLAEHTLDEHLQPGGDASIILLLNKAEDSPEAPQFYIVTAEGQIFENDSAMVMYRDSRTEVSDPLKLHNANQILQDAIKIAQEKAA